MKKLQNQLKSISKSLATLSKQVEKISNQAGKLKPTKAKAAPQKIKTSPAKKKTAIDAVLEVIKRSRKGTTIAALKEKTGFNSRQLSNALYKLSKRDMIASKTRGVYMKK